MTRAPADAERRSSTPSAHAPPPHPGVATLSALRSARGACLMALGRYEDALEEALHCVTLSPVAPRYWVQLGDAQLGAGHPHAASAAYSRALLLHPGHNEAEAGLHVARVRSAARPGRRASERSDSWRSVTDEQDGQEGRGDVAPDGDGCDSPRHGAHACLSMPRRVTADANAGAEHGSAAVCGDDAIPSSAAV